MFHEYDIDAAAEAVNDVSFYPHDDSLEGTEPHTMTNR